MFYYYVAFIAVMSILDMILMIRDKAAAIKRKRRTSEDCLLLTAAFGGAIGGFLAMILVRHKTRHWYFALLLPMFAFVHILFGFLLFPN